MSKREPAPLACLDANIFLAVLIPEATRAPKNEIAGAARVLKAVEEGHLQGVTTAILFGEIRYAYLRENKLGFEIARAAIEAEANTGGSCHRVARHSRCRVAAKVLLKEARVFVQRRSLPGYGAGRESGSHRHDGPPSPQRPRVEDYAP
jgi:predicted nucleic acid-binding protein